MAAEGMRSVRHNGGHPLCSASRASLLTGRYGTRMHTTGAFGPHAKEGTSLDETILAQLFKAKGYRTAAIGKWHLGSEVPYLPTSRGFDSYFGLNWSVDMNPKTLMRNTAVLEENTDVHLLTPRYTEEALKVIEGAGSEPFFLYLGYAYPHDPPNSSPRFEDKTGLGRQGDAIAEIDWSAGEILKALDARGLTKDTLVLFTSDHGPWFQGCPGNLRGRKGSTWEGGLRVPFLAKLPGVVPAGVVSEAQESHLDVLPTLAMMCGLGLPEKPLDGVDVSSTWTGGAKVPGHAQIYFAVMSKHGLQPNCICKGDWKLRVAQAYGGEIYVNVNDPYMAHTSGWLPEPELYNVARDPAESYNVANLHPEIVQGLATELDRQMATFPEEVQELYAALKANVGTLHSPVAAPPRFAKATA
jgi:arylsulfatase